MAFRSFQLQRRIEAHSRCMTQVCTSACGHVASIASGSPFRPSQHTISASFQASVAYLGQMPTASIWCLRRLRRAIPPARVYSPSTSTPTTTYAGRLMTVPLVLDLDDHGIYVHKWDNTRQGAGSTQSVSSFEDPVGDLGHQRRRHINAVHAFLVPNRCHEWTILERTTPRCWR